MRGSFLTDAFEWKTELLSVRHFSPGPGVKKAAEVILPYAEDIVAELGINLGDHLVGMTTDGGGEIRKLGRIVTRASKYTWTRQPVRPSRTASLFAIAWADGVPAC